MMMNRLRVVLLLILALAAAPLAPVRAGWVCPDGTPCVERQDRSYVCPEPEPAVPSCCKKQEERPCKHGRLPGLSPQEGPGSRLETPGHCRFVGAGRPQLTPAADGRSLTVSIAPAALPATAFQPSLPAGFLLVAHPETLGYRPPPLPSTGPSRAPPLA